MTNQIRAVMQLTTKENNITYHNALCLIVIPNFCMFLLGVKMVPRETENNAYAKFWGDKQRALWYVMVFSVVVNFVPCWGFTWILYSVFWFLQQSMSHAQYIHVWSSREDYQVALFFDTIVLETIQGIF